jgi:hypothetical protein
MGFEEAVVFSVMTVLSVVLLAVSVMSFVKYRSSRMLLISVMLGLFFVQSVLLSLGLFVPGIGVFTGSVYIWVFEVVILCVLYVAAVKP